MYNRSISFKVILLKATSYINDVIIKNSINSNKIFNQLNIILPYVDIIGLCNSVINFMRNLCDVA